MNSLIEISKKLDDLAKQEYQQAESLLSQIPFPGNLGMLIEACRVLDALHINYTSSNNQIKSDAIPDYETTLKGWNPLVDILLRKNEPLKGIPIRESTDHSRQFIMGVLHQLGRYVLLEHTISMIKYGMADARCDGDRIIIEMGGRLNSDHFLDVSERDRTEAMVGKFKEQDQKSRKRTITDISKKISELVFPWETGHGTIISYDMTPEVDEFYLTEVFDTVLAWRNMAGIHPEAKIKSITGADLIAVATVLVSFRLKHRDFVGIGMKSIPNANYYMSLPIWIEPRPLIQSISGFTGISIEIVEAAINLLTLHADQTEYFKSEPAPYMPLLIEISPGYLLAPVSSIYRNVFSSVRMFAEFYIPELNRSLRDHRETWMISELYALFQGTRYHCVSTPVKLRDEGKTVTDIDAAIFDMITGDLALFQLKWQDSDSNLVRKQMSKAKNFIVQIDDWAAKVTRWISNFGNNDLKSSLGILRKKMPEINSIYLFGIGRLSARFQSYGQEQKVTNIAVSNWDQFIRIRVEVGAVDDVFKSVYDAIRSEAAGTIPVIPIPHEMTFQGQKILFKDMWNRLDESFSNPESQTIK